MPSARSLLLHVDEGRPIPVQIRRELSVRSLSTGRDLQELHGWVVTADSQLHHRLSFILPALTDRPVRASDEAGDFAGRWCISWNSYGEAASVHTYTLILREAEELSLRALMIDDLELHPYEYREETLESGLRVRGKILGTEEEVLALRQRAAERDAFDVVRLGIQDEPRAMRLSVEEWSEFEDRVKYRITLCDPAEAEAEGEGSRTALVYYANFLEQLAETLVRRGVLSREELRALRSAARSEPGVSRHELWRVADLDQV